jgi:endoribonuclease Dicer
MDENHMDVIFEEEEDLPMDSAVLTAKARQGVYRTIKNWTFTMPNLDPTSRGFNVSPKIARLVQILQCFQKAGDSFRGIVFGMGYLFLSEHRLISLKCDVESLPLQSLRF